MNKAQKISLLIALVLILFSVLYPPYVKRVTVVNPAVTERNIMVSSGWDWIFNLKCEGGGPATRVEIYYEEIRFDILLCEILAVGALAGFFIVLFELREDKELKR